MDIAIDRKGPCEAFVSITVPAEEFAAEVQKGLAEAARNTRMKGFRPGKVPGQMLEKAYGEQVRDQAKDFFVRSAYRKAIEEHELHPAVPPQVDLSGHELADSGEFAYQFQLWLRPEIELGEYKGLEVQGESLAVLDQEVEQTIEGLRMQMATTEPTPEGEGLPEHGMALAKLILMHADEEVLSRDGLRITPDNPPVGIDEGEFKEALVGTVTGNQHDFPFTFPQGFERAELEGAEGICRLEIGQTFAVTPASDEELCKHMSLEDADQIPVRVEEQIGKAKRERENERLEAELLEQVIGMHTLELPEGLVEEHAKARLETVRAELMQQELSPEEIETQVAEAESHARENAERAMTALYLVEAIAQAEKVEVAEADVVGELRGIAQRNQASFEEVANYYREQGLVNQLGMELLERKVRAFLRENASISRPE